MAAARYVSVFHPSNAKSLALRQASIDVAYNTRMNGVRFDVLPWFFAPTKATKDWSYLSDQLDYINARGLSIMLTGAYGPFGGDWAAATDKIIANADKSTVVSVFMDALDYIINTKGVPLSKLIVEVWNEPDNTSFGAPTAGYFHQQNTAYFNSLAAQIKTTYPTLKLASPSFSVTASGGIAWHTTVNSYNCPVSAVHWQYYDYINLHLYLNLGNHVPAHGPEMVRKLVNMSLDNFKNQLRTVPASGWLINKPLVVSEFGFDFNNAGMVQSAWAFGGETDRARYIMEAYSTLAGRADVVAVNFYNALNVDSSDDSRTDTQHYGMCDSSGNPYVLYTEVAKAGGAASVTLPGSGSLIEPS